MSIPIRLPRSAQRISPGPAWASVFKGNATNITQQQLAALWLALVRLNGGWNNFIGGRLTPSQITRLSNKALSLGIDPQAVIVKNWMGGGASPLEQAAAQQLFGAGNLTDLIGA